MKLQKLTLIASALALTLTAVPVRAKAQTNSVSIRQSTHMTGRRISQRGEIRQLAQVPNGQGRQGRRLKAGFQKLNLTEEQRTRMRQIREGTKAQIEAILTSEQKAQLAAAAQNPQGKRQAWRNLNLSETQRNQIRQIKQSQKNLMEQVLTAEQKQQIQQWKQNRGARRQQRLNNSQL